MKGIDCTLLLLFIPGTVLKKARLRVWTPGPSSLQNLKTRRKRKESPFDCSIPRGLEKPTTYRFVGSPGWQAMLCPGAWAGARARATHGQPSILEQELLGRCAQAGNTSREQGRPWQQLQFLKILCLVLFPIPKMYVCFHILQDA